MGLNEGILDKDRVMLFLIYPGVVLLDISAPQAVLQVATELRHGLGLPGYKVITASLNGGPIVTAEGLILETQGFRDFAVEFIDTIFLPGTSSQTSFLKEGTTIEKLLTDSMLSFRRIVSFGSGVFFLAKLGFLDNCRITTHWGFKETLQSHFSNLEVVDDVEYIQQGSIWTSPGFAASFTLALGLVEADCGKGVAATVAGRMP